MSFGMTIRTPAMMTLALSLFASLTAKASSVSCENLMLSKDQVQRSTPLNPNLMHYQISGRVGAPVVILLHGMGGNLNTWTKVQDNLSRDYRVLSVDQRGHGLTPNIGEDYSTETLAKDLAGLMDSLKIQHASIIGHSLGSRTAQKFIELYPSRVDSFISEDMDAQVKQVSPPDKVAKHLAMGRFVQHLKSEYDSPEELIAAVAPFYNGDHERAARLASRIVRGHDEKTNHVFLFNPEVIIFYGFQGNIDDFGPMLRANTNLPMLFLRANPHRSEFFNDAGVAHLKANGGSNVHLEEVSQAHHTIHDEHDTFMILVRDFLKNRTVSPANRNRFYDPTLGKE